jgi:hypothetical protein
VLGTVVKTRNGAIENACEIDDRNQLEKTIYVLSDISSNTWWTCSDLNPTESEQMLPPDQNASRKYTKKDVGAARMMGPDL